MNLKFVLNSGENLDSDKRTKEQTLVLPHLVTNKQKPKLLQAELSRLYWHFK